MKSEKVILSPSMLSCNFARLEEDILKAEKAGCEYLHLDVMDGDIRSEYQLWSLRYFLG